VNNYQTYKVNFPDKTCEDDTMECNLCGRDLEVLNKTKIEGSILDVCDKCVKFGEKIVDRQQIFEKEQAKKVN